MDAANLHKTTRKPAPAGSGELVLQNGRQAGARRPLNKPTTFIGRNAGCEIRLNLDGIDPLHCLLAFGPDGVELRDLNSVHGTYVNGERAENAVLRHGDLLKVGPFQFRVELTASPIAVHDDMPVEDAREPLRIQASAVAAQQIALEEEEGRLHQRRSDLQRQEEQLAAHLAEKQRQVQLWSEYTKAERETMRKEKIEQEKRISQREQELHHAKEDVSKDHQKLTLERQRINKVYQRLRQRWQRQWAAEKEKYQKHAKALQAEAQRLEEGQSELAAREAAFKHVVLQINTQRELDTRQLQETRTLLAKDQEGWRRRRSLEHIALKAKEREIEEAHLKLAQARQLLLQEKHAWDNQLDSLKKELHGLNNRIIHQRECVHEQDEKIARLYRRARKRRRQLNELPAIAWANAIDSSDDTIPECEVIVLAEDPELEQSAAENEAWQRRCESLDRLAGELTDQRLHLIEQYKRLAEIQDVWQRQREHACAELETLARRLLDQERTLAGRAQQSAIGEELLQQRQQELDTVRQEIQIWRAQLRAREQLFEADQQKHLLELRQKETALQDQITALAKLRERWNGRRQQEVEQLRAHRASLQEQHKETQELRLAMFEKGQKVEEESRILAERALALEQYRQEVFFRAKDPAAQRRVERLRRRWLTANASLIRNAKNERTATRKELAQLETQRTELLLTTSELTQSETALAEKKALLEVGEALLKGREAQLNQQLAMLQSEQQQTEQKHRRMQDEVETLAKAVYDDADPPASLKAA